MKRFALGFLALTSVALADQAAVNDPQYQPNAGTIFGDSTVSLYNSDGFKGSSVVQRIGYAPKDNMSFAANLSYGNVEQVEGLGDVLIDGKYRMQNGANRFDLLGGIGISPGDSETKSNGDENGYSGGHSFFAGAEYGNRTSARTWSITGLLQHNMEATEDDKSTGVKTKDDAHQSLTFAAKLYTVLGENCGILATAGVNFTQEYDDDQNGTTMGNTAYILGGEYQHVVNQSLYLKGGFTTSLDGNGSSTQITYYHVGAGYQF